MLGIGAEQPQGGRGAAAPRVPGHAPSRQRPCSPGETPGSGSGMIILNANEASCHFWLSFVGRKVFLALQTCPWGIAVVRGVWVPLWLSWGDSCPGAEPCLGTGPAAWGAGGG